MTYASLPCPLQVCKNSYQSVMNNVLVILLRLMLGNLYACSPNVLSTNTVTTKLCFSVEYLFIYNALYIYILYYYI